MRLGDIPEHWPTPEEINRRLDMVLPADVTEANTRIKERIEEIATKPPKKYVNNMSKEDRQIIKQVGKIRSNVRGAVNSLDTLVERVGRETPLGMLAEELRNDLAGPAGNTETLLAIARELTNAKG